MPRIVAGLQVGRAFSAIPVPEPPVIRRGASGPFHDKGLAGASHHAVIPNVNTVDTLREVWPRLSGDERRLFDVIARSYLAAMMPDFRYRQTTVTLDVARPRVPGRRPPADRARLAGRLSRTGSRPRRRGRTRSCCPRLRHGETARLRDAVVEAKETRPPPRYNEGTLIEAMQNAWRFVADEALRERLKEAKGIGTPATRAEIIRGLKAQEFLVADGKHIVPTERGLALFGVLERADPALVDPGVTAQMERLLDDVLVGRQDMMAAIDAVCAQASRIIGRLTERGASEVIPSALATEPGRSGFRRGSSARRPGSSQSKGPTQRSRIEPALGPECRFLSDGSRPCKAASLKAILRRRCNEIRPRPNSSWAEGEGEGTQ